MLITVGFIIMYLLPPLVGMEQPSPQVEEIMLLENITTEPINKKYVSLRLFGSTFVALVFNSTTIFNPSFLKLMNEFFTFNLIAIWLLP